MGGKGGKGWNEMKWKKKLGNVELKFYWLSETKGEKYLVLYINKLNWKLEI